MVNNINNQWLIKCLVQELNLRVLRTVGLESTALTTRPTRQMFDLTNSGFRQGLMTWYPMNGD
jgi:hypothetical protein